MGVYSTARRDPVSNWIAPVRVHRHGILVADKQHISLTIKNDNASYFTNRQKRHRSVVGLTFEFQPRRHALAAASCKRLLGTLC